MSEQTSLSARQAISWDDCFIYMAQLIAQRSKDPTTQAGAVIVNEMNVVLGLGYNGWPRGIRPDQLPWSKTGALAETKYAYVVHAEENAVFNTSLLPRGCRMYTTLFPCNECAKAIVQVGITEVVYDSDKYHDQEVWQISRKIFDLAGVTYRQHHPAKPMTL